MFDGFIKTLFLSLAPRAGRAATAHTGSFKRRDALCVHELTYLNETGAQGCFLLQSLHETRQPAAEDFRPRRLAHFRLTLAAKQHFPSSLHFNSQELEPYSSSSKFDEVTLAKAKSRQWSVLRAGNLAMVAALATSALSATHYPITLGIATDRNMEHHTSTALMPKK
ncbi:hypothetical protein E4U34_003881 [Claviceps purpurea]|nr:hypothetical protein E4U34_003881 [Claviceps purpurea]